MVGSSCESRKAPGGWQYGPSPGVGIWVSGSQEALASEQGLPQVGRGSAQALLGFLMKLQREDGETQDSLGRPLMGRGGDGHLGSADSHIRVSEHRGLVSGAGPQVGRGEGPGPAGMFSEDAEGGPRDPAPQPRVSPGRYVRGGGWEHVMRPHFSI